MRLLINKLLFFCFLFLFLPLAKGQPINDLKKEKEKLEKEISFTKGKITEIKTKQSHSLSELMTLQKQIEVRSKLVSNISNQILLLNKEINENKTIIHKLENDIKALKDEYAKLIYNTYVNRNEYDNLLFIFSAQGFNDAYKRYKYMKEYATYRQLQADMITKTQQTLKEKVDNLQIQKNEKEELLQAETNQNKLLTGEKDQVNKQIKDFKSQESHYSKQVKQKEKEAAMLNKQIEKMIAEAAKPKVTASTSGSVAPGLTPEAIKLSASFSSNKGKLPWPVERGTIIRGFGNKQHPVLKDVYTNNNGIDISTTKNAEVRSVFDGEVMNTFYHPVFHRGIIISHGEYFTVYLNLKNLYVSEGAKVNTKQVIGIAHTNDETANTEVHLEIWQGTTLLNPSIWLYK